MYPDRGELCHGQACPWAWPGEPRLTVPGAAKSWRAGLKPAMTQGGTGLTPRQAEQGVQDVIGIRAGIIDCIRNLSCWYLTTTIRCRVIDEVDDFSLRAIGSAQRACTFEDPTMNTGSCLRARCQ